MIAEVLVGINLRVLNNAITEQMEKPLVARSAHHTELFSCPLLTFLSCEGTLSDVVDSLALTAMILLCKKYTGQLPCR